MRHDPAISFQGVRALRRFVSPPVERCEFCRAKIAEDHPHLIERSSRRFLCACPDCAKNITAQNERSYQRVNPHQMMLPNFNLTDSEWAAFQIPIDLAFIFQIDAEGAPLAVYPGPAGATESWLNRDIWGDLIAKNPVLAEFARDVEGLLINRTKDRRDYFRASADHCYALIGLMRRHWRGLSGGAEAWQAIDNYFERLARASTEKGRHV